MSRNQGSSFNDDPFINNIKSELDGVDHSQYSSIVATKHNKNINIAHYSDVIFSELQLENENRKDTFNILQKMNIEAFLNSLSGFIWGPFTLSLLFLVGLLPYDRPKSISTKKFK